ncbi:MAG: TonB-dependent siderophore receptor [Cyanobacteria bacterium P01_G01_bin.19]
MKVLLRFLSVCSFLSLVVVSPVGAETTPPLSSRNTESSPPSPPSLGGATSQSPPELGDFLKDTAPHIGGKNLGNETQETYKKEETPLRVGTAEDLLAQGVTRVTGVEVIQTAEGFELILKTVAGSERLVPLILPEGNDLIIDILDATLAFSIRNGVEELNPALGISRITVNKAEENSIRVRIAGENQTPSAEIVTGRDDLVLSITPDGTTVETEPDEQIDIIATGQAEDDDYRVDNASTATKTDTPLRDIPQSIQVVPQQILEDRNVQNLNQATETVSGVVDGGTKDGSSSGGRIIRGFRQDGNFRNGYRDASNFFILSSPINVVERIEVLKGPASVLFGDIEPGGIVNVVTKQPLSDPFYELKFEAGNYDFYEVGIDLSGPLTTNENLLYRLIAAYQTEGDIQDFVDADQITVAPSLAFKIGENTNLNLYYEYVNYTGEPPVSPASLLSDGSLTPRDLFTLYPDLSDIDVSANRFGYTLTHEFNDNWQIRNNFAGLVADTRETDLFSPNVEDDRFATIEAFDVDFGYENYFVQLDVVGEFKTGPVDHQVVVGFDFNDFTDDYIGFSDTDLPILDFENPNYDIPEPEYEPFLEFQNDIQFYGIYVQDLIALGDFKLLVGGRYDWIDSVFTITDFGAFGNTTEEPERSEGAFSPRVGLVYQPSDTVALFTSFSRSFNQETGFSTSTDVFEPTRGTQYEIGVKTDFLDNKLSATLAAYNITKTNVTTTDPDNPQFSIQTGEQRSQGIELDIQGEISPGWNVTAAYAYTDAEVTEDNDIPEGNRLQEVPENQASLWTTYTIQNGSLEGLGFGLGLFYVGERQGDLANSFLLEDYFRTDAALFYRRGRLNTAINVRNLFDVDYISSSDSASRNFLGRGEPFTITGSISYEF